MRTQIPAVISLIHVSMLFAMVLGSGGCDDSLPFAMRAPGHNETESQLPAVTANLPVQQPLPSGPLAALVPPRELLAQAPGRRASYYLPDLRQDGSEFDPGLPNNLAAASGPVAEFAPNTNGATGLNGLAYAMYRFQLEGYDLSSALLLDFAPPPAAPAQAWLGLGNFSANRWDWYRVTDAGAVVTPGFTPYIDFASHTLLAVVALTGTQAAKLWRVSIGSGISGQVCDTAGTPIAGVSIQLLGVAPFSTDAGGNFSLWGLAETERLSVTFRHPQHMTTTSIYEVLGGANVWGEVRMLPRAAPVAFDATAGGEVQIPGGGSVTFPAGGLVDAGGEALAGQVDAYLTFLDVTDPASLQAAPGDFWAVQQDDSEVRLKSYGMVEIAVDDGNGGEANLAAGQNAQLKLPIPPGARASAPAVTGLYYFDETSGKWQEDGTLAKDPAGEYYEAEVGHFSSWNCDDYFVATCFRVKVVDELGQPVRGVRVFGSEVNNFAWDSGVTGSDGMTCLLANVNENVKVWFNFHQTGEVSTVIKAPGEARLCGMGEECEYKGALTLPFAPYAYADASVGHGPCPLSVSFDAARSYDRDGTIATWEWDPDGTGGAYGWQLAGPSFEFTYADPGAYFCALRITDNNGHLGLAGATVYAGVGGGSGGDSWMLYHDQRHTGRSSYNGPQTNNLRWTSEAMGMSCFTPVIGSDGTLYATTSEGKLYAFNPADGSILWSTPQLTSFFTTGPAIGSDGTLYVPAGDYSLYALSPLLGQVSWRYFANGHLGSAPAIGPDGRIYFGGADNTLYAVDTLTHNLAWSHTGGFNGIPQAGPALGDDGSVYYGVRSGWFLALNALGQLKWDIRLHDGSSPFGQRAPVIADDGTVYMASSDSTVYAFAPADGTVKWQFTVAGENAMSTPALGSDGTVYVPFSDGMMYALDPADGAEKWHSVDDNGTYSAPVVGADGLIYAGSQNCFMYCFDPADGSVVWEKELPYQIGNPALILEDGTLVVSSGLNLYAFQD